MAFPHPWHHSTQEPSYPRSTLEPWCEPCCHLSWCLGNIQYSLPWSSISPSQLSLSKFTRSWTSKQTSNPLTMHGTYWLPYTFTVSKILWVPVETTVFLFLSATNPASHPLCTLLMRHSSHSHPDVLAALRKLRPGVTASTHSLFTCYPLVWGQKSLLPCQGRIPPYLPRLPSVHFILSFPPSFPLQSSPCPIKKVGSSCSTDTSSKDCVCLSGSHSSPSLPFQLSCPEELSSAPVFASLLLVEPPDNLTSSLTIWHKCS